MTRRPIEFELFSFVHKVHYSVANFEENNCFFCVDHELINLRMNTVYSKVNYVNPCRAFIFDLESSWLQIVLQKSFLCVCVNNKKKLKNEGCLNSDIYLKYFVVDCIEWIFTFQWFAHLAIRFIYYFWGLNWWFIESNYISFDFIN